MADSNLVICLLTYARTEYAITTLATTLDNIRYTRGNIYVHIADDGSDEDHRSKLFYAAQAKIDYRRISMSNAERGGYGRNVNLAFQTIHHIGSYILMLEDDWELTRKLNLDDLVDDLEGCYTDMSQPRFDCVRLGYLSFTQDLRGQITDRHNRKYFIFDSTSPEPHIWAGHPRLETVQRQRECGLWPENELPGTTEFMMAHVKRTRRGVAWPMDLVKPYGDLFAHIGTKRSY